LEFNFICLCPTYGRPRLVESAIAMFQAQTYPKHLRRLLILDDAGQIDEQCGDAWSLFSTKTRFPCLPAKYESLVSRAGPNWSAVAIWDDDDIFMPWHLEAHADALRDAQWSHPGQIATMRPGGELSHEATGMRFWSSMACRRSAWERSAAGWYGERRADFDQQFLRRLATTGPAGRPDAKRPPSYVYGWGRSQHATTAMTGHGDESWYSRVRMTQHERVGRLTPSLDAGSKSAIEQYVLI